MEFRKITDDYAVSGQIEPEDVAAIKAAGFKSVVCNRPDDEQPGQTSAASLRQAVEAAGLGFRHVPVVSGNLQQQDVQDMAEASDALMRLRPVTFHYKAGYDDGSHLLQYGLIAEEVAQIAPELVQNDANGKPFTVRYHAVNAMLLNELQKQHAKVEEQASELARQKAQIEQQEARIQRLEALLSKQGPMPAVH